MKKNPAKKTDVAKTDREHLEQLVAEHLPRLKSFIRKRVGSREDAEDVLQDVFYQLVKMANITMNPVEHVAAWLYRVARNTIINRGKKKQEEPLPAFRCDDGFLPEDSSVVFSGGSGSPATPETEYLRSLVWLELETALSELPPEQREAFELMELDGLPAREVAGIMGISVNTLLSRKRYAVIHLRKRLKELYDDILTY